MTRRIAAHRAGGTAKLARLRMRRVVAILGAIIVATTGMVVLTSPASAATRAYGFEGSTGWLGTVTAQDGTRSICVNPIGLFPSGTTTYVGLVSAIDAQTAASNGGYGGTAYTTGAAIQELNYALGVWVNTKSNITAAALDLFAYSLVADYPGPVGSSTNLNYYSQRAGASAADVRAAEAAIAKQTLANYNKPAPSSAAKPVIDIDNTTLKGTVTASVTPTTAPGVLTLTGAKESGTGATVIDITNDQVVDIDVTPTPNAAMRYTVTASVTWTVPGVPQPKLRKYHTDSPKYAQIDMAPAGNKSTKISNVSFADDPAPKTFAPVISTSLASSSSDVNETLDDTVVADVAQGSGPWMRDSSGAYLAVNATGTWYESSATDSVTPSPPASAKVLGIETIAMRGPGTYKVVGPRAEHPGSYTVVWSINSADQAAGSTADLPDRYTWADEFGEPSESGSVRFRLAATTRVSANTLGLGRPASDTLLPGFGAGTTSWPLDAHGQGIEVPFFGTEYFVPGDEAPATSVNPPTGAIVVATTVRSAHGLDPLVGPETAPIETDAGYLVWQWSTPESEYVDAWTEQFAEPNQLIRVVPPTIASSAESSVALTDSANDEVVVLGPAMSIDTELRWAAYLQSDNSSPVCDSSTLVFDSSTDPVEVRAAGRYDIPHPPTFSTIGTYFWVATLTAKTTGAVIAQGECGDKSERTNVGVFSIATAALATSDVEGAISDSATIDGPVPAGSVLRFRAYKQGVTGDHCDTSQIDFTSPAIAITGDGVYESGDVRLPAGRYDWIATGYDRTGHELAAGVCGDPSERSTVVSSLAQTGWSPIGLSACAALALVAGSLLISIRFAANRRNTARTDRW